MDKKYAFFIENHVFYPLLIRFVNFPAHHFIIIIKIGGQRKAERESDIHPISPKTPAQQYLPIDRKKRKWKLVEDYSSDRAA